MKKYILTFFIILCALYSDENKNFYLINQNTELINLTFELDEFDLENKDGYVKINSNAKGETGVLGMPKLPQFSAMLMLDPSKEYDIQYNIVNSYKLDNVNIIPNQNIVNGLENSTINSKDLTFYDSNLSYPYINVSMTDPMIMRDLVLASISVIPYKFLPASKELEVYDKIEIVVSEIGDREDIRRRDMAKSRVFENIYKNKILNYEVTNNRDEYQMPAILYICSSNLDDNAVFQQLVDWRTKRGYTVYTASTAETGNSTTSIKNYIENVYDNYDPVPEYVALLGDVGGSYSLPTYYEDFGHDNYGSQCEGDHPYSQLDGNDLLPEILIGRMSIRSTTELSTVVSKILNYEKATYLSSIEDYYERAAMAGDPSTSGNSCAITKQAIKGLLENHDFSDVSIKTSGSGWSTWMQNELSEGVLFFNYRGYLGMSGFSTSNVDNANNGYKLPFATVLTCGTGSFAEDNTSMSEKFFRAGTSANPKGGVAAIGTATWNTHTLFNNIVDMGIYDGILADNVETAGAALASGKFALYSAYPGNPYEWISAFTQWNNLMGDPATHLWSDTPTQINVTHLDYVPVGTNYFDILVQDENGNPVENAMVTLVGRTSMVFNYFTDDNGSLTIDLDDTFLDEIPITVTKNNHQPYEGSFTVLDEEVSVNFDQFSAVVVSGDGIASAGETVELSIPLKNSGYNMANNVTATLSSTSNLVTIDDSIISYGNIGADETVYGDNISISISSESVENENLFLQLTITDSNLNSWTSNIPLYVSGSLLLISNSGFANPGEVSYFDISLTNQGSMEAISVSGTLNCNNDQVEIVSGNNSWGNIYPGQTNSSLNSFAVSLSSDLINGSQIVFSLVLEDSQGYSREELFNLTAGNVSVVDPLGPDQYGYYIYDSNDSEYDLSPDYNWIEIDPGYGGDGSDLNLNDSGDGNWSGNGPITSRSLPFIFKFYGLEYDEITISTNGWIAPGGSDAASFRNYPIPGAGGPSPMIAAFWDDLETSNGGDVFYYSTDQYVIIEWSDMRTQNNNSLETFQIILYNNSFGPNGDNDIKIQYKEFDNDSSGSYGSYPPMHGGYATIGIENHFADDGLQYSFHGQYPISAMTLSDNTALYITTQSPVTLPAPELTYNVSEIVFEIEAETVSSTDLIISNTGEEGSLLYYSISKSYADIEAPFDNVGGGPDLEGYFWSDSDLSNDFNYDWVDISEDNIQVVFETNDTGTGLIDIGFDFPFYGENYSQFLINANGWVGFENDSDSWYNGDIPSEEAPKAAIFGFWDDLNPVNNNCNDSCSGNVYYNSNSDRLVVWFNNVYHWASEGYEDSYYDFQIIIYPDGSIDINIRDIVGNYSATVGIQNSSGLIATQVDQYNGDYFESNTSYKILKAFIPTDWLTLSSIDGLSGELLNGEYSEITTEASSVNLINGNYFADIIISVNNQDNIIIPVSLSVNEEQLMLGDMNDDGALNVSDIVILVNVILSQDEYVINGDINQDGLLDVIDIVQLVSLILNG